MKRAAVRLSIVLYAAVLLPALTWSAKNSTSEGDFPTTAARQTKARKQASPNAAYAPLPDEALKRAQEAEKQLASNNINEALAILTRLDHDYPGHAALSLRLAQIYDKQDTPGVSLFFYRRYSRMAADHAREEAQARLATLELTPGAPAAAEAFAAKMGERTAPAATPAPVSRVEIAAARPDGSLVPIHNREEAEEIAKGAGIPDATPSEVPAGPTPYVISPEALQHARSAGNTQQARTRQQDGLVLSGTGDHVALLTKTPQAAGAIHSPAPATTRGVYATGTPETGTDEDAQLARAFAKGTVATAGTAANSTAAPLPPDWGTMQTPVPASTQLPPVAQISPSNSTPPAPVGTPSGPTIGTVAYMSPTPSSEVISPRAKEFFTTRRIGGDKAVVKLYNDVAESVATIKIIPLEEGNAMSAILAPEENRALQFQPGKYDFVVNVATTNYPPLTLMQTRFSYTFEAGMQYLHRINNENMEQVR